MARYFRLVLVLAFVAATPFLLPAQDAPPAQAPPPATAAAPAGQEGAGQDQFDDLLRKLKAIRGEMDSLLKQYRIAKPEDKAQLLNLIKAIHAKGLAMQEQFFAFAEKAYDEAPNANQEVIGAMLQMITRDLDIERYAEALKRAQSMIDKKCEDPAVYERAGIAAFSLGKVDLAKKYLVSAKREAPEPEKEAIGTMLKLITRDIQLDRYQDALQKAQSLIDDKCDDPAVYDRGGIAAFNLEKLDLAEKYLNVSKEKGTLNDMSGAYLQMLPDHKEAWAKEQQLREAEAKADDLPRVMLKTSKGDIELELFENEAPNTVANFISLVEKGFYNNLTFHRVLPGFMAQAGCPEGTGTGGPGYHIPCECYRKDHRKHFIGTLSMAKGTNRDTGGSQFFLTFRPTQHLDGKHTVFGRVIKGLDVLPKLQRRNPQSDNPPPPDKILEAKVVRKRNHPYKVKKAGDPFDE